MPTPPAPELLWSDPLARSAATTTLLACLALATLGVWVVLWRAAFFAHASSSLAFPAAVAGSTLSAPVALTAGALAGAYASIVAVSSDEERAPQGGFPDATTALAVVAAFALGVIAASELNSGAGIDALLFGSVLAAGGGAQVALALLAVAVLAAHSLLARGWLAIAFDPPAARALGVPVRALRVSCLVAVAVSIAAAIPALGALLAPALATLPAAAARIARDQLRGLVPLAVALAMAAATLGVYTSFWLDLPPGPSVAIVAVSAYALCAILRRVGGVAGKGKSRRARAGAAGACAPTPRSARAASGGSSAARRRQGVRGEPLVVAEALTVGYEGVAALSDVTFELAAGEAIALIGPNGSGKTTLLRALVGELKPLGGRLEVRERPAYLPQSSRPRTDIPLSALDVAVMGTMAGRRLPARPRRADRERALAALAAVGMEALAGRRFALLSGGQRQRVLLARALAQGSRLLLLDEPLAPVDPGAAAEIEDLLLTLRDREHALIVATHDLESARRFDRVLCLNRRLIACGPPEQVLVTDVLAATYGRELLIVDGESGQRRAVAAPHRHAQEQ